MKLTLQQRGLINEHVNESLTHTRNSVGLSTFGTITEKTLQAVDVVLSTVTEDSELVETIARLSNERNELERAKAELRAEVDAKGEELATVNAMLWSLSVDKERKARALDRKDARIAELELEIGSNSDSASGWEQEARNAWDGLNYWRNEAEKARAKVTPSGHNRHTVYEPTYLRVKKPEGVHELIARHRQELNALETRLIKAGN